MNSPKLTYSPKLTLSPRLSQLRKYHISDKLKAFDGKVMVRREIAPGQFSEFILYDL